MAREIFKYVRANTDKLKKFGFTETDGVYNYRTPVFDNKFTLFVSVYQNGEINTKTVDNETQDEYILHLIGDSAGDFVGKVRSEYKRILEEIKAQCYEKEVFAGAQSKEIIEYIRTKYGDELEFLWEKFNSAIWRRKDNKKWYGLLLTLPENKLGLGGDGTAEVIDLRAEPDTINEIVDNVNFFKGYHMNKQHWFTIVLNSGVPTETVFDYIDKSYSLALKK